MSATRFPRITPHELAWLAVRVAGFSETEPVIVNGSPIRARVSAASPVVDVPEAVVAVAIALAEEATPDSVDPESIDYHGTENRDLGCWRISTRWHSEKLAIAGDWRDPVVNARLARAVFDETAGFKESGFQAWAVFNASKWQANLLSAALPFHRSRRQVPFYHLPVNPPPLTWGDR